MLPQGSRGLKAVTKYKLGYDPKEISPEDMLPYAREKPQVNSCVPLSVSFSVLMTLSLTRARPRAHVLFLGLSFFTDVCVCVYRYILSLCLCFTLSPHTHRHHTHIRTHTHNMCADKNIFDSDCIFKTTARLVLPPVYATNWTSTSILYKYTHTSIHIYTIHISHPPLAPPPTPWVRSPEIIPWTNGSNTTNPSHIESVRKHDLICRTKSHRKWRRTPCPTQWPHTTCTCNTWIHSFFPCATSFRWLLATCCARAQARCVRFFCKCRPFVAILSAPTNTRTTRWRCVFLAACVSYMDIYIGIYVHTYTYIFVYTCVYTYVHTYIHTKVYICI